MRPLTLAVIQAGLVDPSVLNECKRWGMIPRDLDTTVQEKDAELAVQCIQDALEDERQVRLQHTDLDLLKFYLDKSNQRTGQLVLKDEEAGTKATKNIVFACRSHFPASKQLSPGHSAQEYIIPWISESITDILTNGATYLRYEKDGQHVHVRFFNVEEMFFGDTKAFLVCKGIEE